MKIIDKAEEYRQQFRGAGYHISSMDIKEAFEAGAEWMQEQMIDKLRELKQVYEHDLDTEPRIYERHIQLCAKLSLVEKLIQELEDRL